MDRLVDLIPEFKEDLKKQIIVLMGLPAAGKSTFINLDLPKMFTGFSGYKVTNTDVQLKKVQYDTAVHHFNWLNVGDKNEKDFKQFSKDSSYTSNLGKEILHPVTWKWWEKNKKGGVGKFYKEFYQKFYKNYYDLRAFAKAAEDVNFGTKVKQAGNYLIIDTTGVNTAQILSRLEKARAEGFHTNIILLDINVDYSIARDKYRGSSGGREVGPNVIKSYPAKLEAAYKKYLSDGKKEDGIVDRLLKFTWVGQADPRKGSWKKEQDHRFSLKRTLKAKKAKKDA